MRAGSRVVAYTAAFGPLSLPHVQPIPPDVPLVCFTDQPGLSIDGYDVRLVDLPQLTPQRRARYVKVMAHAMFPDADWAIWFDAPIRFKTGRLSALVDAASRAPIAIHRHALRSCVYDEAEVCRNSKLDDPALIEAQMARYRQARHPAGAGLWESGLLVRRVTDPSVIELNTAWWGEVERGSVRDQLSLPVVVRRLGIEVQPLAATIYNDPFASMVHGPMSPPSPITLRPRRWQFGWPRGRRRSQLFDEAFYRRSNDDVFRDAAPVDALRHYRRVGWREGRDPHPLFDVSFYLERYPDVLAAGVEPLAHYLSTGAMEGRDPHVLFDTRWYLDTYGDACRLAPGGALGHYLRAGWRTGARPNRWFNPASYLDRYPDVRAAGVEPLQHYLLHGIGEARDLRDLIAARQRSVH